MKHYLNSIAISVALALLTHVTLISSPLAGPLAGNRGLDESETPVDIEEKAQEDTSGAETSQNQVRPTGADELVSSYVNTMRQQLLPDLSTDVTQQQENIDLDGLQGWSLEEISKAMGLLADQAYDENADAQPLGARGQNLDLNISVEDLYNFNAGYYFVVDQQNEGAEQGRLVTDSRIPELMGISALGAMQFNTPVLTGQNFGLDVTRRNAMFDSAFFETASRSSTSVRIPGRTSFGSSFSPSGPGQGGSTSNSTRTEGIAMAEFIQRIIDGIRENWLNLIFGGLGVGGIVYVTTRLGS